MILQYSEKLNCTAFSSSAYSHTLNLSPIIRERQITITTLRFFSSMYPHMWFNLVFIWEVFHHYVFSDVFPEGYSLKKKLVNIGYKKRSPCVFSKMIYMIAIFWECLATMVTLVRFISSMYLMLSMIPIIREILSHWLLFKSIFLVCILKCFF